MTLIDKDVDFADVLTAEMKVILDLDLSKRVAPRTADEEGPAAGKYEKRILKAVDDAGTDLAALCLSGGGIRSATFALGVIQGLARFGLLGRFHYLSSVSGGGYIASWLSVWRKSAGDQDVFDALNSAASTGEEAPQITGIRADSNYLTPQLGLLSADTWTVITLYVRNLLLNWMLFVPFFMGCLMFPRVCMAVLSSASGLPSEAAFEVSRALGGLFVIVGLSIGIYGRFRKQGQWLTNGRFRFAVLGPLVASGASFTYAAVVAGLSHDDAFAKNFAIHHVEHGIAWGATIYFIAWLIGRIVSHATADPTEQAIEKRDVLYWTISGALVGTLVAIGMSAIADAVSRLGPMAAIELAEVLGLSGFVLAYLTGELFYVGIASFSRKGDMDREWLARSSGWLSAAAVGWATFSAIALYAPELLDRGWNIAAVGGGASGLVTLLLGSSALTAATKAAQALKSASLMRIASAAAIVFAVLIAALLALTNQQLEDVFKPRGALPCVAIDAFLMVALIGLAIALSCFVNVNRFSMHALYRNRLVRAFLGSARAGARNPDPFTGFDPKDNLPLAGVEPLAGKDRLFHVISAALNVVSSKNRAWQERKAESFTMSRLYCGNPFVRYRPTEKYGGRDGLSLGTAMAISGAAVSPNQGYNSSPLIGFLLMLFNVRLGWWLGSPKKSTYYREGPTRSLSPALRELAGDTTDESKWIYLSDGGHFENLALYEMIRRRCRRIIISDAGCDPACTFEDLGNAVRKIYIDFGVSIEFEKLEIKARQNPPVPGLRFALGTIKYPGSSRLGWLLYLKPTYQGTMERVDVRSYASTSLDFPHESTTDQWFSESQLESYRALGASIAEYVCSGGMGIAPDAKPAAMTFESLHEVASMLLSKETSKSESRGGSQSNPERPQ